MALRYFLLLIVFVLPSCQEVDLGQELEQKQELLGKLAEYSLRSEVGAIGYRSRPWNSRETGEWVQVTFDQPYEVDQIVLVPTIRRDSMNGLQADGFPEQFEITVGMPGGSKTTIRRNNDEEHFLPRIAPYVITLESPIRAEWIQVRALRLGRIGWNDKYFYSLSEIMAYSGRENVALHQAVSSSSTKLQSQVPTSRNERYLVDGHLPYSMDAAEGARSVAYLSSSELKRDRTWEFDLGEPRTLQRFKFHRIELDDTIPQSEAGDYGVPSSIMIQGAIDQGFTHPVTLLEQVELTSIYDIGPILSYRLADSPVRYVRIYLETESVELDYDLARSVIGCAEIELISDGVNVALGKTLTDLSKQAEVIFLNGRSVNSVTDGLNYYGDILDERKWVEQLSVRHTLEREIPLIEQKVIESYTRQKQLVGGGSGLVVLVAGLSWFLSWWIPKRERRKFKERFAADIHDELGANLHTISFISDGLEDPELDHEGVLEIKSKIRHVAERAGRAVYHMTGLMEESDLYRGLIDDMGRAVERVLGNHEHTMQIEGEELLDSIPKMLQVDILLFYQECLVNIGRHSDAEKFETSLIVEPSRIRLRVRDFGAVEDSTFRISKSLQRRARLLRGKVEVVPACNGGIVVSLDKRR